MSPRLDALRWALVLLLAPSSTAVASPPDPPEPAEVESPASNGARRARAKRYDFDKGNHKVEPPRFPKALHIRAADVSHIKPVRRPHRRFVPRIIDEGAP